MGRLPEQGRPSRRSRAPRAGRTRSASELSKRDFDEDNIRSSPARRLLPSRTGNKEQGHDAILKLMEAVDDWIPTRASTRQAVPDADRGRVLDLRRGTVVTGRVEQGIVKVGEEVEIVGIRDTQKTVVTGVEMFRKLLDQGQAGDNIGALCAASAARTSSADRFCEAGLDQAAHRLQRRGLCPVEGRGRPSHAVLRQLSSVVLPSGRRTSMPPARFGSPRAPRW